MTQIALILNEQHNEEIRKAAARTRRPKYGARTRRGSLLHAFSRWTQYSVDERNPDQGSGGLNRRLHRASG